MSFASTSFPNTSPRRAGLIAARLAHGALTCNLLIHARASGWTKHLPGRAPFSMGGRILPRTFSISQQAQRGITT